MAKETSPQHLAAMRHTAAHMLAAASTILKKETRLGVGPAIEDGFYHDIDVDERYSEDDLKKLQAEMEKIKAQNLPITQREVGKDEARELFKHDPLKLELIEDIEGDTVGISDMGNGFFVTLCKGGHVESTGEVGFFTLTRLAGVYWKGDEERQQLQRIYGVLFPTEAELSDYVTRLEEAKKRDHRKLGKELDLFTFSPLVGSGLPLFTPRGTFIREQLQAFIYSLQEKFGYQRVIIPHIAKAELYKTSGHWDKFKEDLFHVQGKGNEAFVMKPMNCPHHTQIYAAHKRSHTNLPLRYCESTTVYRDEQAGQLQGLSRVRAITQDDAHVFCRPDQIEEEVKRVYEIITQFYSAFNFELSYRLSLRDPKEPQNYLGDEKIWVEAQDILRRTLTNQIGEAFEEAEGEAAFYGPKIDFTAKDSIGRTWQLATIQLDFNMPLRFKLSYTDEDGLEQTPVMIHRAILGSFERFMAIILEHYAGYLPLWLAPTQAIILPISDEQLSYAETIKTSLQAAGIRVELDARSESIGKKIRLAEQKKIPMMLIVGKKEVAAQTVAVRSHAAGDEGALTLAAVQEKILTLSTERA